MSPTSRSLIALTALLLLVITTGCSDRDPSSLEIARASVDPLVFADDLDGDVYPQPFFGTYSDAVSVDTDYAQAGTASMKVVVPASGSSLGAFAGGVLTAVGSRDLADYNALTFYARSSIRSSLDIAGFGNDNTGTSLYEAGRAAIPLSTEWTFVVIPIPAPSRLIAERGLFTYAEGFEPQSPAGHEIWFDEIRFADLGNITNPRPVMPTVTKQYFAGGNASLEGTYTTFDIDGADVTVGHMPGYFDFTSSDPAVAEIIGSEVRVIGTGNAVVTGTLQDEPVEGAITVTGFAAPSGPAPTPTLPAGDVVSMFSDAYTDVPVTTWDADWQWSTAEVSDYEFDGGDTAKQYSALNFVGVDFLATTIDATAMTHFHMDVFAPQGTNFKIKIIVFSADNGGLIDQSELVFDAASTPAFTAGDWVSLDIPLSDFGLTASLAHIGQLALSTDDATLVLVDNVYWHR